jgi:MFS family permease
MSQDEPQQNDALQDDKAMNLAERNLQKENRHRLWLFIFSSLGTLLYVGAFFGWGPMQLLLENNGAFSWKCTDAEQENDEVCPEQTSALLRVPLVALSSQIASPLLGMFTDTYGPKYSVYFMTACIWTGLTLLVISVSVRADWLLYLAFTVLAFGSWMGGLMTVQTGMYFTGVMRSRVIFTLNALFDSGSITYLGLWGIGEASGANLTILSSGYLGLAVVLLSGGLYFWTVAVPAKEEEHEDSPEDIADFLEEEKSKVMARESQSNDGTSNRNSAKDDRTKETANEPIINENGDGEEPQKINTQEVLENSAQAIIEETESALKEEDNVYVIIAERSPREQLTSAPVLWLALFFAIQMASNLWVLTSTRDFLASLGDDELNNKYLTIFTIMMPASLVALPFIDAVLVRFGMSGGFYATNLLGLGYNLVRTFSDNLNVQVLGFILFSFFRCFLFGVTFSFLPTLVSPKLLGKVCSMLGMLGGIVSVLNIPLAKIAIETFDGDFFIPNVIYTGLLIPCVLAAWGISRGIRQEERAKKLTTHARLRKSYVGELQNTELLDAYG